jgi:hypothetical protein
VKTITCIVEGDGDVAALPVLLRRMAHATGMFDVSIPMPIRTRRDRFLNRDDERRRIVGIAALKARDGGGILILLDADDDCIADRVAKLSGELAGILGGTACAIVFAKREFESWFIAAIDSLRGRRGIRQDAATPNAPEDIRDAKGWLRGQMSRPSRYSETIDQPALANLFDWQAARKVSPSLDKLCREFARLIGVESLGSQRNT